MDLRFVVLSADGKKIAKKVPRLPIVVGRSEEAKFRFKNDSVSRKHCEFFVEDDVVFVRDLGSTNGTLLDRTPLVEGQATAVPSGSVVQVGAVAFQIEYDAAAAAEVEASPAGTDAAPTGPGDDAAPAESDESAAADGPQTAFAGLAAAEEPATDAVAWPTDSAAATPPDDENLNDFFKSLS